MEKIKTGKLYIVGTPIGNLEDITLRALRILKEVDVIACEDTRHSGIMLSRLEIKKPLISYYKEKEVLGSNKILQLLDEGKSVALISDAGMPCISDPGSVVIREARDKGYEMEVIPGASACVSAASLCGLETGFTFYGFLPDKNTLRKKVLDKLKSHLLPVIFYVAPHNLKSDLNNIYNSWGNRDVYLVKELTKIYESVIKTTLEEVDYENIKGEYVVIVMPIDEEPDYEGMDVEQHLLYYINLGYDKKNAIKIVASERGLNKNDVYQIALKL